MRVSLEKQPLQGLIQLPATFIISSGLGAVDNVTNQVYELMCFLNTRRDVRCFEGGRGDVIPFLTVGKQFLIELVPSCLYPAKFYVGPSKLGEDRRMPGKLLAVPDKKRSDRIETGLI
jgi:hypothetical protein